MPQTDSSAATAALTPPRPGALDAADLGRWGVLVAVLLLGGLVMASGAGDDYMLLCGMLFAAFGLLLGVRLLLRWTP